MSTASDDILSNYVQETSSMFRAGNVESILNLFDALNLTRGDLRGKESALKQVIEVEKGHILEEEEVSEKLNSEIKKIESDYLKLLEEKRATEGSIEEKRKEKIPSKEDENSLQRIRKTLRVYKDITKIRWDYSASENVFKGYIYGYLKNYVHPFEISSNDSGATEMLWQEIENASLKASNDTDGKENVFHENIISASKKP